MLTENFFLRYLDLKLTFTRCKITKINYHKSSVMPSTFTEISPVLIDYRMLEKRLVFSFNLDPKSGRIHSNTVKYRI